MNNKNLDLSKIIMKKVASFEKKRSIRILFQSFGLIIFVFSISGLFLYLTFKDLIEQRSFEFLALFGEDFEIIKSYWKDSLLTFWEELPQDKIIITVIFLIIGIVLVIILRKRIKVIFRKLKTLAKLKF